MAWYFYTCNVCGHEYTENRVKTEAPWKTVCNVSGCAGSYQEVKK